MLLPCLRDLLPGVLIVESPLLPAMVGELGFSPEEWRVVLELHERGYANIDFPDNQLDDRIERIKENLGRHFDMDMATPESVKTSCQVQRIQDAWTFELKYSRNRIQRIY